MKTMRAIIHIMLFLTTFLLSVKIGPDFNSHVAHAEFIRTKDIIYKTISEKVPSRFSSVSRTVADAIIKESLKQRIDPFIVTAVIAGESSFNPKAVGPVGELGLMQIRPSTAKWIAKKMNIPWRGASALTSPDYNIEIGVAYLGYLKKRFSPQSGDLYLAAYNMGETTLLRLLSKKMRPSIYSRHVMKNYIAIN